MSFMCVIPIGAVRLGQAPILIVRLLNARYILAEWHAMASVVEKLIVTCGGTKFVRDPRGACRESRSEAGVRGAVPATADRFPPAATVARLFSAGLLVVVADWLMLRGDGKVERACYFGGAVAGGKCVLNRVV